MFMELQLQASGRPFLEVRLQRKEPVKPFSKLRYGKHLEIGSGETERVDRPARAHSARCLRRSQDGDAITKMPDVLDPRGQDLHDRGPVGKRLLFAFRVGGKHALGRAAMLAAALPDLLGVVTLAHSDELLLDQPRDHHDLARECDQVQPHEFGAPRGQPSGCRA
jgi:hypothetical protein